MPRRDKNQAKKVPQFKVLACLLDGPRKKFECNICCWICVDCDLAEANRHVNAEHGLNLVQYYKMASGKVSRGEWSDACLFKCHICWSFITTSKDLFIGHLKNAHDGVSESEYINEYSSLTFLESYLECKRCGETVLHTKNSIENHSKDQECQVRAPKMKVRGIQARNVDLLTLYRRSWHME